MILHLMAILTGLAVLAASTHVTIEAAGGYQASHAPLTIAIAAAVGIGALAIGSCWSQRRRSLAIAIAIALLCGELFGLATTAERLVASRDESQAPTRKLAADRAAITAEITRLERALADAASSPRLTTALQAQRKLAETVSAKAVEKGCAANCRALLEEQSRQAAAEVDAARAALAAQQTALATALAAAQRRLFQSTPTSSSTPLADRLGLAPWKLDLIIAALGAIGANGLGATLIAFGAHRRPLPGPLPVRPAQPPSQPPSQPTTTLAAVPVPSPKGPARPKRTPPLIDAKPALSRTPVGDIKQHAARFGVERLEPAPQGSTTLTAIHAEYRAWCASIQSEELPPAQIAEALAHLLSGVGIAIRRIDGAQVATGIAIKPRSISDAA